MKLYYRAVTQDGETIRGLIEAKDPKEAAGYLRKHKLIPIKIFTEEKKDLASYLTFFKGISTSDLIFFTRQLALILSSGLTLMQALSMMKSQIQKPRMVEIVQSIIAEVEDGRTLSSAISKFPNVFSPIYIALIRTAESSGLLDKVLLRLASDLEKKQKLERTIKSALMYPLVVILMMVLVIGVMLVFVIPQLSSLYGNMNISLPLPTVVLMNVSKFFINYWLIGVICIVAGSFYFRRWVKKPTGKRIMDKYVLKIPIFGKLLNETMMAEFTRTFGLLISSGSLVVDSLLKSSDIVGNTLYKEAVIVVAKRVEKGITIGNAMEASRFFPPMVIEMVKIGEQTGKLDESLMRASNYYEEEVEQTVKTLTTLMEPIIMIALAVGVGFLIMAIITPIYSLISAIQ
jgi:type II secretory pathway component PulF